MTQAVLSLNNVSVRFGARPLVDCISFEVRPRSLVTILGPSGAGKSTLLRAINRLLEEEPGFHVEGDIRYQDRSVLGPSTDKHLLRRQIGIVFQRPIVFPVSIERNVLFGVETVRKVSRSARPHLVKKYLEEVGLWEEVQDRLKSPAQQLSVGQQQRLALARTLAVEPEVLLLDEPTSALDSESAKRLAALLLQLKQTRTLILVTHDTNLATEVSDQVFRLRARAGQGSVLELS